jgi:hypothetical protein
MHGTAGHPFWLRQRQMPQNIRRLSLGAPGAALSGETWYLFLANFSS